MGAALRTISIHALVKRATASGGNPDEYREISIHALVKRATLYHDTGGLQAGNFNPRPREEGDCYQRVLLLRQGHFNPRPREEGDPFVR